MSDIVRSAKKSIVLIDNYVDDTVLAQLDKRKEGVTAQILTKSISKQLALDLKKHNEQYALIEAIVFPSSHDRFLVLDGTTVYHLGASLKDLGKKWFAFSKMEASSVRVVEKVKEVIQGGQNF
jgi:hypothetical protein